jgi:hypothetical protein
VVCVFGVSAMQLMKSVGFHELQRFTLAWPTLVAEVARLRAAFPKSGDFGYGNPAESQHLR